MVERRVIQTGMIHINRVRFVGAGNQFTCDLYTNQSWDCRLLYLEHLAVFACICVPLLRRRMPGLGMKTILR